MRRRLLRVLATTARGLGLGVVFAGSLAAAVVLHADLPPARRVIGAATEHLLGRLFEGTFVLQDVERVRVSPTTRVRVARVDVLDRDGRTAITALGVEGQLDLATLVRSLLTTGSPNIVIDAATVEDATVALERDADGSVRLAHAFRRPGAPATPAPPAAGAPAVSTPPRLRIRSATVGHAWVHGDVLPPMLDGDASDVHAEVSLENGAVAVDVTKAAVVLRAPTLPVQALPLTGTVSGTLEVVTTTTRLSGKATLVGETGGLPLRATASLDGEHVVAEVTVPTIGSDVLARAVPALPIVEPASLTVTAKGNWPSLAVDARAVVGAGRVSAMADVDLRGPVTFTGVVDAAGLDLRAFGGPASSLNAKLSGTAAIDQGNAFGTFRVTSDPSELAGEPLPPIAADARFENRTLAVSARADEPGVRAVGNLVLDVPTRALAFDVQARAADLRAVPRLRRAVGGAAAARATGKIDLAKATVTGSLTATGDALTDGTTRVGSARATAYLSGPLRGPVADVYATAKDVRFATEKKAPLVYPSVEAQARVALPSLDLRNVTVRAKTTEGAEPELVARADRVAFARGGLAVEGGRVEGMGGPIEVSARTTAGGLHVRARGTGLEVERAAAVTGIAPLRRLPPGTRADVDVDLGYASGRADGHVDLRLRNGRGFEGSVTADIDRGHARGEARVALASVGEVRARSFAVDIPGPFDRPQTWAKITGSADLEGTFDLAYAAALFPDEHLLATGGQLAFTANVVRASGDAMPTARATFRSEGLSVTEDFGGKSETIAGVDLTAHLAWDGLTDDAEAAFVLYDHRSALATGDAKAALPIGAWLRGTKAFSREALADLGVELRADVVRRELRSLPSWLVPARAEGAVEGTLTSTGPLGKPTVTALFRGLGLRDRNRARSETYGPIDATVDLHWDGQDVVGVVTADEQAAAADARRRGTTERARNAAPRGLGSARGLLLMRASARDLVVTGSDPALRASAELSVDKLDIGPLPLPYNARGTLSGRFSVRDVNGAPSFQATTRFTDLVLQNAAIGSGDVAAGGRDGALFAVARLTQKEGGSAQAQVVSKALRVGKRSVAWDDRANTRIDYALTGMRLSMVRPIVRRLFQEIDGRVDGRGSITLEGDEQTFEGGAAVSDGRIYVNLLGEEITNVGAVVYFDRNGVFRVQDATGRIGEGDLRASVTGRMKGLHFQAANAFVVVPSKRGIPLSTEGATYAEAVGQANLQLVMSEDRSTLLCSVDVPTGRAELPDRRTQQLEKTDDDPTILIGKRLPNGRIEGIQLHQRGRAAQTRAAATATAPAGTTPVDPAERDLVTRFSVAIGRDVWVEGRGMRLAATGLLLVEVGDQLTVNGRIDITEGTVDVQGRRFTVDRGTLTFTAGEAPDNPTLLASAYWDAPDGTRVWAEFAEPIQTGKLTLRSEPPYSYNEILSLLLFGRPEGNVANTTQTGGTDATGAAGVAGGAVVAPGLNRALEQLSGGELEIKANVAAGSGSTTSRPEIEIRRGRLGVSVGYVVGTPSPVQPDRTLVTVDWQFLPRWSVAATRGDESTTILDVLYRYRY